jgi:histidinol-phosphatase (PHP family)
LEDVILEAIRQKFESFALTEHMPRDYVEDLYPEEVIIVAVCTHSQKHLTPEELHLTFDRYYHKALSLRTKYADRIRILVGFETEYIRADSIRNVQTLQEKYAFDYCVGSIHHVMGIPIDFNVTLWEKAREACGGTDELLFEKYFDEQYELLVQLKPLVVGHFDVIRLWAPDKMVKLRQWTTVWTKVLRNIDTVIQYGGLFEFNSAAFRKGFSEAYPTSEIAEVLP